MDLETFTTSWFSLASMVLSKSVSYLSQWSKFETNEGFLVVLGEQFCRGVTIGPASKFVILSTIYFNRSTFQHLISFYKVEGRFSWQFHFVKLEQLKIEDVKNRDLLCFCFCARLFGGIQWTIIINVIGERKKSCDN
jgi:hypothetical protein